MTHALANVSAADGQGLVQIIELVLAFLLSSLIGFERQLRGKSAGLRTQAIVGTTAALMMLVSKYGFNDVLNPGHVILDPSRVAAQIVSGIGFLGAGLILTRRGAVRGLTTAAAVWETAAIGMAAGAGLWLLALVVTALHFVIVYAYTALAHRLPGADVLATVEVTYVDGEGVLRRLLAAVTSQSWRLAHLSSARHDPDGETTLVTVAMAIAGSGQLDDLVATIGAIDGTREVSLVSEEDLD